MTISMTICDQSNTHARTIAEHTDPRDYVFLKDLFLEDFPAYQPLLESINMPDDLRLLIDVEDARQTVGQHFSAGLSVHHRGQIGADLAYLLSPTAQQQAARCMGYMLRRDSDPALFHVAVTFQEAPGWIDRPTLVHEYGHYVEQRVAAKRKQTIDPYADRATAFMDALQLVQLFSKSAPYGDDERSAADELVAWLNAIWLCWMAGMDPRIVIVGLLTDAISHGKRDLRFLNRLIPALAGIVQLRTPAAKFFGGLGRWTFDTALARVCGAHDIQVCQQIDKATSMLIRCVLVRNMVRG